MNDVKIGFIGAGNIASAIVGGISSGVYINTNNIYIYDLISEKAEAIATCGANTVRTPCEVASSCDVVFLTIKPQIYPAVLEEIKGAITPATVLVSVAPGISIEQIKKAVGFDCKVIRTMPNTPLLLGQGAVAVCTASPVTPEEFETVKQIFASSGIVAQVEEAQMDAVIAVHGSSPAYIFLMAKAVVDYAVSEHISYDAALELFAQTLRGAADMLIKSGKTPDELIAMVKSPKGTTEAALETLEAMHFYNALTQGMKSCTKRAVELGGGRKDA